MKRVNDKHTTLVLVLLDGSHRTTQWYNTFVDFNEVKKSMKDTVRSLREGNEVVWAFLACGQQHMQYTANEVKEFTS